MQVGGAALQVLRLDEFEGAGVGGRGLAVRRQGLTA